MPWGNQSDKEVNYIARTTRYRQFVSQILWNHFSAIQANLFHRYYEIINFSAIQANLYHRYYETISVQLRLTSSLAWKIIFFNEIHNQIVPAFSTLSKKRCTSAYFHLGKNHNKLIYGCNGGKKRQLVVASHPIFNPYDCCFLNIYMIFMKIWSNSASSPVILILD